MNSNSKIGKREAIFFILIVMINKIILNLPKSIIQTTGTGALINILFIGFLALLFVFLLSYLFKKFPNEDIIDISEYLGGKTLKIIIGLAYIILFSLIIATVITRFSDLLKIIYFKNSPYALIISFFLIGICFSAKLGSKSIIKANFIILPLILLSLIIILFGISDYASISGLFPILGNDIKTTFVDGSLNIFAFGGIKYLFFLMPLLKNKKDFKKIAISSIILSTVFLFFIVGALLLVCPFIINSDEILSVYLLVRIIQFGDFLQRTDALFILLWVISALSYLSISMMFIITIFKKLTHVKRSNELSYSFIAIIFGVVLLLKNPNLLTFLENSIYKYYVLILVFAISTFILLFANFKKRMKAQT